MQQLKVKVVEMVKMVVVAVFVVAAATVISS